MKADAVAATISAAHKSGPIRGAVPAGLAEAALAARTLGELLGSSAADRPGLVSRTDLRLDRLGLDRRLERGLETPERFALSLRQVHAGAEPVARGRRRDEQARDFVPERVAGRREVPAERESR